jgi:hypothetical protein
MWSGKNCGQWIYTECRQVMTQDELNIGHPPRGLDQLESSLDEPGSHFSEQHILRSGLPTAVEQAAACDHELCVPIRDDETLRHCLAIPWSKKKYFLVVIDKIRNGWPAETSETSSSNDDDQWTRWIGQECANPNYSVCATHYFQTNGMSGLSV